MRNADRRHALQRPADNRGAEARLRRTVNAPVVNSLFGELVARGLDFSEPRLTHPVNNPLHLGKENSGRSAEPGGILLQQRDAAIEEAVRPARRGTSYASRNRDLQTLH